MVDHPPRVRCDTSPPLSYCLPAEYAAWSLLPEVRDSAIATFSDLDISWHSPVNGGPGNNLLSSQVQCVNALAQMMSEPARLIRCFAPILGTVDVAEIEPGRYLTFEYIGPTDYFTEGYGRPRVRGERCTSVDAAFVHRTHDGTRALVLLEWKYTETYPAKTPDRAKTATRRRRYERAWRDPDGPVRADLLDFELVLDEPFYQLVRQQLLAHELEKTHAEGADRVRVVHVSPPGNIDYQASLPLPEHRALGSSVSDAWSVLLRHPDRFLAVDSAMFATVDITSTEYVNRYSDPPTCGAS